MSFKEGGVEVHRNNNLLYFNKGRIFVTVKTVFAISEFYDSIYSEITEYEDGILAKGTLTVPSGSEAYAVTAMNDVVMKRIV